METLINNFHFIRPLWFWALIPLALIIYLMTKQSSARSGWKTYVSPELLPFLIKSDVDKTDTKKPWLLLGLLWLIAVFSLAGPTWEKLPTPIFKNQAATVFILDLSPSMLAEDIKPNRETRARQKLMDAVQKQKEGLMALVAYSGEAHLVTPLTDDARTLSSLIPALSPRIMPLQGSNLEMALELAIETLRKGHIDQGRILLLTDGVDASALPQATKLLEKSGYALHIISLGDETGAPIPLGQQGFAKDAQGNIVVVKNDRALLRKLSSSTGGSFSDIRVDDRDIEFLAQQNDAEQALKKGIERDFDQWQDNGYWLAWLLIPLFTLGVVRGLFLSSIVTIPLLLTAFISLNLLPSTALADTDDERTSISTWDKLWLNKNQQGQKALSRGDAKQAAELFEDPRWKATADYQSNNFNAAKEKLSQLEQPNAPLSADDLYNLGNSLAQSGELKKAISAYESSLKLQPDMQDAIDNKKIIEDLLKQQQENNDNKNEKNEKNEKNDDKNTDKSQNQDDTDNKDSKGDEGEADKQDSPADKSEDGDTEKNSDQNNDNGQPSNESNNQNESENEELGDFDNSENPTSPEENKAPKQNEENIQNDEPSGLEAAEPASDEQSPLAEAPVDAFDHLSDEEKQAMEQWLRQVQDDPSGLLRRKFEYQYRQRREAIKNGEWQAPENDAHTRW